MIWIAGFNRDNFFRLTAEALCRKFNRNFSLRTRRDQSIKCDCCTPSGGFDGFDLKIGVAGIFDDKIMNDVFPLISEAEIIGIDFKYSIWFALTGLGRCYEAEKKDCNNELE